ncbi:GntR family transcriptional regulator [Embleya sp. NPDC050154]|uniref:GntR family transcriptional regulator n=1 Tax=Embleya sp. NPDC050154 TaxID=3363988 RepID=UPI003789520C
MSGASPRGTYLTIADALRRELAASSADEVLLSESEIQARFGVARSTVRRALAVLAEDGLVESRKGIGWRSSSPSSTGSKPLHERIVEDIYDAVRRGELATGDPIRSEAELAALFEVSRGKVRQALAYLEGAGIVVAVPGKARQLSAVPEGVRPPDSGDGAAPRSLESWS